MTTIRAGTPMYLMSRMIKSMGIKMVLSGEGSDEIFGGYLYFHKAPNATEFHEELVRKLSMLHLYDCLRANKAMMPPGASRPACPSSTPSSWTVAMSIDPKYKMIHKSPRGADGRPAPGGMEKYILRKAFDGWLPEEILWRQKEQFSDGVGYSWIDSIKAFAEREISDSVMANARYRFPQKTPVPRRKPTGSAASTRSTSRIRAASTSCRMGRRSPAPRPRPYVGTRPGPTWPIPRVALWLGCMITRINSMRRTTMRATRGRAVAGVRVDAT